jgi:hypothetical protein
MGIKRYTANADTTITNAYKANLQTRGTGSNMGLADSLEVFHIYGQESSSSAENSRVLIDFPVTTTIAADRSAGTIPASGSVSWFLRVHNVVHPNTLPKNYNMTISAISRSWDEGTGLDMEGYTDSGSCNWTAAASSSGGVTAWTAAGGDYHASPTYTAYFDNGTEDIEIDISHLVEEWVKGTSGGGQDTYGVGMRMENESALSSSYTKKFSARGSQYFFSRPTLEARWDSTIKDDRGNFYYSSSLAPAIDNLNTLYLYNYSRGRLVDIPGIGSGDNISVSFYASTSDAPSGSKLLLPVGGGVVTNLDVNATGSWVSTGIYSANLAITASATPLTTIHDVWHSGSVEYQTGSITPNSLNSSVQNSVSQVVMNITNLRDSYYNKETARFRLYTRQKNWNPTIYTKASSTPDIHIVESGSFKVVRLIDDLDVVAFGTGSDMHTQMSFDASGSYFDLDMSMLEAGYGYGLKFAFYDGGAGAWNEYPDVFKFRVEE